MKPKLKVGDILIAREIKRHPHQAEVFELIVSKVGRKYFEVEREYGEEPTKRRYRFGQLLVEDWKWADSNARVNRPVSIYLTRDEMEESLATNALRDDLLKWARGWNPIDQLTTEQVRAIHEIVFPVTPP